VEPREQSDTTSRRDFLCQSAAAVGAGVAVAVVLPEAAQASQEPDAEGAATGHHRWVYLIDTTRCIGCGSCARACRAENEVPEGFYRTWIERYEIASGEEAEVDSPDGGEHGFRPKASGMNVRKAFFVPKMCNHCEETPCTQVCPVGASYKSPEGVILVDAEHCIGCGYCVQACPYGSRFIHPVSHTASKCTWCYHRTTKGLKPACVYVCPTGARKFGDREDPDDEVVQILATERVGVLQQELLTKPQCFYLGLDMEVR